MFHQLTGQLIHCRFTLLPHSQGEEEVEEVEEVLYTCYQLGQASSYVKSEG